MANHLKRVFYDTKKVFSTRWAAKDLHVPSWVISAIIYITALRSLSYGLELLIVGVAMGETPLLAFVAILGVQVWGFLITLSVVVLIIGLLIRNSIVVTFGALICSAVWAALALILGIGWFDVNYGGRYAVAAFSTAATWVIFFILQLRTLRKNGVET